MNHPPVAGDVYVSIGEYDGPTRVDVLQHDYDVDPGQTIVIVNVTQPASGGNVTLSGQVVTFAPGIHYFGNTSFTYTITDGDGGYATGTAYVAVLFGSYYHARFSKIMYGHLTYLLFS